MLPAYRAPESQPAGQTLTKADWEASGTGEARRTVLDARARSLYPVNLHDASFASATLRLLPTSPSNSLDWMRNLTPENVLAKPGGYYRPDYLRGGYVSQGCGQCGSVYQRCTLNLVIPRAILTWAICWLDISNSH